MAVVLAISLTVNVFFIAGITYVITGIKKSLKVAESELDVPDFLKD